MVAPMKGPSLCPDCYLFDGMDVAMKPTRAGSQHSCERNHTWDDLEVLQNKQDMARHKRSQMAAKQAPELQEETRTVPAVVNSTGTELVINQDDRLRISEIVGDFTDGASLYGSITSLTMDIKNLQEELKMARRAAAPGVTAALNPDMKTIENGDMPITILVPEQYVQGLKDFAESNTVSVPDYMNDIIANGFAGGWFFGAIICVLAGVMGSIILAGATNIA